MIITFTLRSVIRLAVMSAMDPPSTNIFELDIASSRMGMMTGKPRMAIITELLLVLLEMEETIVKAELKPSDPKIRFRKNGPEVLTGNPRNTEKTINAIVIRSN